MTKSGVQCMVMRGGSSKGAYFLASDLPVQSDERDSVLRQIMGSPDARQIDGIGGAHPLTSKVAIVGPSTDGQADIDYLFLQVGVDDGGVSDRQNCGNLLAGVGPFALERGLLASLDSGGAVGGEPGEASVRILMQNTNTIAVARFGVRDGDPIYDGTTPISGVPGAAAPIHLDFEGLAGGSTGALLPTGNLIDTVNGIPCTMLDNGMPVIVMRASDLGVSGYESCADLEANAELRSRIESVRLEAGPLMALGDVKDTTIPKLTIVAAPRNGGHISTRTFIPHRCHEAIGVLGAVSVATAALLPGSVAHDVLIDPGADPIRLEHPTGFFDAVVEVESRADGSLDVPRAGIVRTARKLMDGFVFPRPDA